MTTGSTTDPRTGPPGAPPCAIALCGDLSTPAFGPMLRAAVLERELERRVPGAVVRRYATDEHPGPNRFDAGRTPEPLGGRTGERVADLAAELDCIVVTGAVDETERRALLLDGLGPELERETPVVWTGVVLASSVGSERLGAALGGRSVVGLADEASLRAVTGTGAGGELLPDLALLAPAVAGGEALDRRLRHLEALGVPRGDPGPLVLEEGCGPDAAELATRGPVVVVPLTERQAAAAPAEAGMHRVDEPTLEDVLALVRSARLVVCADPALAAAAVAMGTPVVSVGGDDLGFGIPVADPGAVPPEAAAPGAPADAVDRLATHLDRVAEAAAAAAARRAGVRVEGIEHAERDRLVALVRELRAAYEARGRLLATGRWEAADHLTKLEEELDDLRAHVAKMEELNAYVAHLEAELERLRNHPVYRYSAGARRLLRRLRPRG